MDRNPTLSEALSHLASDFDTKNQEDLGGISACCPHCGAFVSFGVINVDKSLGEIIRSMSSNQSDSSITDRYIHQLVCTNRICHGVSLVASAYERDAESKMKLLLELLWPQEVPPNRAPDFLEAEAKQDYDEARMVLHASPAASATLARRCLQYAIRTKLRINKHILFDEIKEAIKSDELSKTTRDALDHVRQIGNFGAHPDIDQSGVLVRVSEEEARYTLFVLELLFDDLYRQADLVDQMTKRLTKSN